MSETENRTDDDPTQEPTFQTAREIREELRDPEAGEFGRPVDARCTGCKRVRVKRAPVDPDGRTSFQHVCHKCRGSTWWNIIRVLEEVDQ